MGFPGGSVVRNLPVHVGGVGLILWSGRSPGEGNGNPLQYSCLGNPMDRGAWQATVHGVAKESDRTKQLNNIHNRVLNDGYLIVGYLTMIPENGYQYPKSKY